MLKNTSLKLSKIRRNLNSELMHNQDITNKLKGGKFMDEQYVIKLFEEYKIRTKWDSEIENYYSVIDVIAVT